MTAPQFLPHYSKELLQLERQFAAACESEFFYDRLSLDHTLLSISILAVDAAEIRNRVIREIEDKITRLGGEIPDIPAKWKISRSNLENIEGPGELRLKRHLRKCLQADRNLCLALRPDEELNRFVPQIRDSFNGLLEYCDDRQLDTGPIPHIGGYSDNGQPAAVGA